MTLNIGEQEILDRFNAVDRPKHYNVHPSGVECIEIARHMNYCRGNVIKYVWRAGLKEDGLQDLKKARWYLEQEIRRIEGKSARGQYPAGRRAQDPCSEGEDANTEVGASLRTDSAPSRRELSFEDADPTPTRIA